jgi:molecular chaperone DnaK
LEAKIQLSSSKSVPIFIDGIIEDENGDLIDIDVTITREEFETIAKPFIERSIELIRTLLKEVGYDINMIDHILLVGGTSCIPLVKQMLTEKFGEAKIMFSEKPMLAIAEGAGILSQRLGDEYEAPITGDAAIAEISYSTNHNYFVELKDEEYDRIIEKQMPLPCYVSKPYKTTVNNQKVVKIGIYADVEGGIKEKQTMGFFTIEDDLPLGSDIVLDITLGIDEVFDIKAYPKNHKSKSKHIVLGRGNKDSKALDFLSSCLEKMLSNNFSEKQRDFFFKSAKKEIERINSWEKERSDSTKWEEIGTNAFLVFEQAERITDTVDEDELAIFIAAILLNEYSDLIGKEDVTTMRRLLSETKNADDPIVKIQAKQKLRTLTDEYPVLITLFTVKMASDTAVKTNPTDGHRLLQMHDQIVNHFRNRRKDEAYTLLDEAIELRDKYDQGGTDLGSIHLGKSR